MKLLYLNHICWNWIFQRPQIIAMMLEKDFDIDVVDKKFIFGKKHSNNPKPNKLITVLQLPKDEIKIIHKINQKIYKIKIGHIINNYDIIWICHPMLYYCIPKSYNGKIVYDCMDNNVALAKEIDKMPTKNYERELLKRADLIFTSSQYLKDKIIGSENAVLVRNGYLSSMKPISIKNKECKDIYKIGYFGTISSWFDFELLINSTREFQNIEYHLIGPSEIDTSKYDNKKIIFEGSVEHSKLNDKISNYDALVMPFKVNDIILSVDPVKLYEYINMGKCIISIWYPEIERFRPFVYFYSNYDEFKEQLTKLSASGFPAKYTEKQRSEFLNQSTWDERYKIIKNSLNSI